MIQPVVIRPTPKNVLTAFNALDFGAEGDGINDDTAAITAAIAAAASAGGGTVFLPTGTYKHTGLTLPAAGGVRLVGHGHEATRLVNVHATAASVKVAGAGDARYAQGWAVEDLTLDADERREGQAGLDVSLARRGRVRDVEVAGHGIGIKHGLNWQNSWVNVGATDCDTGWHFQSTTLASTPNTLQMCSARLCDIGVVVADHLDVASWVGGDIVGNGVGLQVAGNSTRNLTLIGVNFEANTDDDMQVGDDTTAPSTLELIGCRFYRSEAATRSIYVQRGSAIAFHSCRWENYTTAIEAASTAGTILTWGCSTEGVTTFLSTPNKTVTTVPAWSYGNNANMTSASTSTLTLDASLTAAGWQNAVRLAAANGSLGFYGATPVAKQTGVAVTAEAIHAALVSLGLISA